jgi:hypothetical protein
MLFSYLCGAGFVVMMAFALKRSMSAPVYSHNTKEDF